MTDIDTTMDQITELAGKVAIGEMSRDEAEPLVAELCTRHGPELVIALDTLYERTIETTG